jgi:cytidylate kinase
VTITRQYGAGGSLVASTVAESLGWTLIDNEFVEQVAARAGLPVEAVAEREERAPSLMERLVRALAGASPETFVPSPGPREPDEEVLVRQAERVIAEAAQHGRVVLVGRGAQAFLSAKREREALHVYLVAPREARIRAVVGRLGVAEPEAEQAMDTTDAARDRYVERHYGRRRQDPANYHLVLNTGWLGYDGAAEVIVDTVRRKAWA